MKRLCLTMTIAVLATAVAPIAQNRTASDGQSEASYTARTSAILVDVVVRDKKGNLVRDLTPADFAVFEDGVRQDLGSFSLVNRGSGIGIGVKFKEPGTTTLVTPTETKPESTDVAPPQGATALIFDSLSPDSLAMTQRAALAYVPMTGESELKIGVFTSEPNLRVMQPYTSDRGKIRQAIRNITAVGTAAQDFKAQQKAALQQTNDTLESQALRLQGIISGSTPSVLAANAGAIGELAVGQARAEAEARQLESFEALDRDHRGFGTTTSLLTVIDTLSFVPGRKTVVLFSEGLPASPAMKTQLQWLIEAANRFNITIYAVDATGLRVNSTIEETRKEIAAAGDKRLRQVSMGTESTDEPYMRTLEKTEDLLRLDPQGGLARLAEDTGGFLFRDSNDIAAAFRRIDEDSRFHYLLTYSPTNNNFDGKFRTIEVKVDRPGTEVFARKGYRAIRENSVTPVLNYEAPALALLDSGGLPNAFPIRAGGLVFPDRKRGAVVPIIVKVDTANLAFETDSTRHTYSGQVAVVARVKDSAGRVLQRQSQQYVLSGDEKDIDAAKKGEILFYREPVLSPGLYEIEAIAYDMVAQKASARVSTITVPESANDLEMSSVVIVARTEKVPGTRPNSQAAPLFYGDVLMYPNLGDPVSKESDKEVGFYVTVYPGQGRPVKQAVLELLHNGQQVANAPLQLEMATPDADRLQQVGRLPLASVPPGTYELRITVSDGQKQRSRSTFFTVQG